MKELHDVKKDPNPLDSSRTLQDEAKGYLTLLNDLGDGEPLWSGEDLTSILDHQLQAPLIVDLGGMQGVDADQIRQLACARGLVLQSFEDLLAHSHPPVKLLVLTKEFAKRNLVSPRSTLPKEVARVLYFSCIASALLHARTKISDLGFDQIHAGFTWCLNRTWLKPELRELLEKAIPICDQGGDQ